MFKIKFLSFVVAVIVMGLKSRSLNMLSQSPITELQSQLRKTKTEWISRVLKVTKSDTKRLVLIQMCRLCLYFLNFDKWMYPVSENQNYPAVCRKRTQKALPALIHMLANNAEMTVLINAISCDRKWNCAIKSTNSHNL